MTSEHTYGKISETSKMVVAEQEDQKEGKTVEQIEAKFNEKWACDDIDYTNGVYNGHAARIQSDWSGESDEDDLFSISISYKIWREGENFRTGRICLEFTPYGVIDMDELIRINASAPDVLTDALQKWVEGCEETHTKDLYKSQREPVGYLNSQEYRFVETVGEVIGLFDANE